MAFEKSLIGGKNGLMNRHVKNVVDDDDYDDDDHHEDDDDHDDD